MQIPDTVVCAILTGFLTLFVGLLILLLKQMWKILVLEERIGQAHKDINGVGKRMDSLEEKFEKKIEDFRVRIEEIGRYMIETNYKVECNKKRLEKNL